MVLNKANTISSLAFLRSLQAARSYINALVDDLKVHGLTEHPDPISSQSNITLDQQLDDLFVPYLVGSSYIDREKKSLEELYSSLLFKFNLYHVSHLYSFGLFNFHPLTDSLPIVTTAETSHNLYGDLGKIRKRTHCFCQRCLPRATRLLGT